MCSNYSTIKLVLVLFRLMQLLGLGKGCGLHRDFRKPVYLQPTKTPISLLP